MRHQVSESPIVVRGFPSFHILTMFYLCLSIVLKRVHLDPHPWRSLFAHVGAHLYFLPVPVWSSFALLGRPLQPASLLERKWVLACCGHAQLLTATFIQPGHKTSVHRYNILPTSTTCSAFCVTSRSPGALAEKKKNIVWVSFCAGSIFASHMRARLNE